MDSLLILEPELLARLKEQLATLPTKVHVLTAADLADVAEERQLTPAVHLIYQGYRVLQNRSDKRLARIEQTWLAVVAVRNVRTVKTGADARADAGVLASAVLMGLLGWQAPSAAAAMELANAPAARFSGGHQYLPQAFTTELILGRPRAAA